jgi:hypothetical protein
MILHDLQLPQGEFEALRQKGWSDTIVHGPEIEVGAILQIFESLPCSNQRTGRKLTAKAVGVTEGQALCFFSSKQIPASARNWFPENVCIVSVERLST